MLARPVPPFLVRLAERKSMAPVPQPGRYCSRSRQQWIKRRGLACLIIARATSRVKRDSSACAMEARTPDAWREARSAGDPFTTKLFTILHNFLMLS
jgi:hypothetical protein